MEMNDELRAALDNLAAAYDAFQRDVYQEDPDPQAAIQRLLAATSVELTASRAVVLAYRAAL
jgi:hypothetical protein